MPPLVCILSDIRYVLWVIGHQVLMCGMVLPFPDILEEIGNGQGLPDREVQMLMKSTMLMADKQKVPNSNILVDKLTYHKHGFQSARGCPPRISV